MHTRLNRQRQKHRLQIVRPPVAQGGESHIAALMRSPMMDSVKQNPRRDQDSRYKKQIVLGIWRKQFTGPDRRNADRRPRKDDRRRRPFPYRFHRQKPVSVRIFLIIFPAEISRQH